MTVICEHCFSDHTLLRIHYECSSYTTKLLALISCSTSLSQTALFVAYPYRPPNQCSMRQPPWPMHPWAPHGAPPAPTPSATPACIPRTPACYAYGPTCSCTIIPIQPLGISCAVCRLSLAGYTVHVHVGSALLWEPLCPRSNSYKLYAINYTLNTDKVVPLYTCT